MKQCIKKQWLFDFGETVFPVEKGILRYTEGPTCGIESKSFGPGREYLNYKAQGFFDTGKEGVAGLGKVPATVGAIIDFSHASVGSFIGGVLLYVAKLARGTSDHMKFHNGTVSRNEYVDKKSFQWPIPSFLSTVSRNPI